MLSYCSGCCSTVTHHLCPGSVVFTLFYLPISLHHVLFHSISQTIPFALDPLWESNVCLEAVSYEDAFLGWITKVNMRRNKINTIVVLQYLHSAKLFTRVGVVGSYKITNFRSRNKLIESQVSFYFVHLFFIFWWRKLDCNPKVTERKM